jgi:hypothetical protein
MEIYHTALPFVRLENGSLAPGEASSRSRIVRKILQRGQNAPIVAERRAGSA